MNNTAYIESGILELYVCGLLSPEQNTEIFEKAQNNPEIQDEINAIEKSLVALSSSFSPLNSVENFDRIKEKLKVKQKVKKEKKSTKTHFLYNFGWFVSAIMCIAFCYFYNRMSQTENLLNQAESKSIALQREIEKGKEKNKEIQKCLSIIRNKNQTIINLVGQPITPNTQAKLYWNKYTQEVFIDASGLPSPPSGMVYQVWSFKLNPLRPTNIGLLNNFDANELRLFGVQSIVEADTFGITLEPKGGSFSPTIEELYVLGKQK